MTRIIGTGEFASTQRKRIFKFVVLAVVSLFVLRLGWLQIVKGGAYRLKAEAQAIKQIKKEPFRGLMIDRNGRIIVQNVASFTVTITPNDLTEEAIIRLSDILSVSDSVIRVEVAKAKKYNRFNPAKLVSGRDISSEVLAEIEEYREFLPGVAVIVEGKRYYAFDGNASHLFGYARQVSERQLNVLGDSYDPGDITGQTGLEKAYESYIRGQKGLEFIAINNHGQRIASFNDGMSDVDAGEGFDLYLGLDADLQSLAEKLLDGKRGGIVALDPRNGEILAFASKPDYDLRLLAGKSPPGFMTWLLNDEGKPSFNRVSQPAYPPGSIWKMLVALGCMDKGLITSETRLLCTGAYHYGNRSMACHGAHGRIRVARAIQVSCNSFFAQCGMKLGPDGMKEYGELLGFGQKTGVDVSYERSGLVPSKEYMDKVWGKRGWSKYAPANWGIGQGEILVTPLQMARYVSAIANGGTLYQPHAVSAVYNKVLDRVERLGYDSISLGFDPSIIEEVQKGMFLVVDQAGGTAHSLKVSDIEICGKTGTAQNPHGKDHSWFVAYAPRINPTIAICAMVENAGYGSTVAAPMATKLVELYLADRWPEGMEPKDRTDSDSVSTEDSTVIKVPEEEIKGPFFISQARRN